MRPQSERSKYIAAVRSKSGPIFGSSPEVQIVVQGVECRVMIYTGADISCINVEWFKKTWRGVEVRQLDVVVRGAGGKEIRYYGYVELDVLIPGIQGELKEMGFLLIDRITQPSVILGSNIFQYMSDSFQVHEISNIPWLGILDLYRNKKRALGEGVERVVEVKVVQEIKIKPGVSQMVECDSGKVCCMGLIEGMGEIV